MSRSDKNIDKHEESFVKGQLVFAKVKFYPIWPARIVKIEPPDYSVTFFGTHDNAEVDSEDLFNYNETNKKLFISNKSMKRKKFKAAVEEIEVQSKLQCSESSQGDEADNKDPKRDLAVDSNVLQTISMTQKRASTSKGTTAWTKTKVLPKRSYPNKAKENVQPDKRTKMNFEDSYDQSDDSEQESFSSDESTKTREQSLANEVGSSNHTKNLVPETKEMTQNKSDDQGQLFEKQEQKSEYMRHHLDLDSMQNKFKRYFARRSHLPKEESASSEEESALPEEESASPEEESTSTSKTQTVSNSKLQKASSSTRSRKTVTLKLASKKPLEKGPEEIQYETAYEMHSFVPYISTLLNDDLSKPNIEKGFLFLNDFYNRVQPEVTKFCMMKFPEVINYLAELMSFQMNCSAGWHSEKTAKKIRSEALEILIQFKRTFEDSTLTGFFKNYAKGSADLKKKIADLNENEALFLTHSMEELDKLIEKAASSKKNPKTVCIHEEQDQ